MEPSTTNTHDSGQPYVSRPGLERQTISRPDLYSEGSKQAKEAFYPKPSSEATAEDMKSIGEAVVNLKMTERELRRGLLNEKDKRRERHGTYSIRHQIMDLVGYDCEPEVELMLIHAMLEGNCHLRNNAKHKGVLCKICRTKKELVALVAGKFKSPWAQRGIEAKERQRNEAMKQQRLVRLKWPVLTKNDFARAPTLPPPVEIRNNMDHSKPALEFRLFPRLPMELRLRVWKYLSRPFRPIIITLDAENQTTSKIVQMLPGQTDSDRFNPTSSMSKNVLLLTTHESRQAMLETLDSDLYLDVTSSPSSGTQRIKFSNRNGDWVFINHLKTCAASLMAIEFQGGLKDAFPNNITRLAINECNFLGCTVMDADLDAEFKKIGDILCKFKSVKTLCIVVGGSNKKWNLAAVDTELYNPHQLSERWERIMDWSVRFMTIETFHNLVATYAKGHPEWKISKVVFARVLTRGINRSVVKKGHGLGRTYIS